MSAATKGFVLGLAYAGYAIVLNRLGRRAQRRWMTPQGLERIPSHEVQGIPESWKGRTDEDEDGDSATVG